MSLDVVSVNITANGNVDSVNTNFYDERCPARGQPGRSASGPTAITTATCRAMLHEAVRMIQAEGVEALTLRGVGERLGVSRTALYRHFSDKQALLAAVAPRRIPDAARPSSVEAWRGGGRGRAASSRWGRPTSASRSPTRHTIA